MPLSALEWQWLFAQSKLRYDQGNFGQDRGGWHNGGRAVPNFPFVIYVSNKAHCLTVKGTTGSVFLKRNSA